MNKNKLISNKGFSSALIILIVAGVVLLGVLLLNIKPQSSNNQPTNTSKSTEVVQSGEGSVVITSNGFSPQNIKVSSGQRVRFTNNDAKTHTLAGQGGIFDDVDPLDQGASISLSFDKP